MTPADYALISAAGLYAAKIIVEVAPSLLRKVRNGNGKAAVDESPTLGGLHKQLRAHSERDAADHAQIAEALKYQTDATRELRDGTRSLADQIKAQGDKLTDVRVELARQGAISRGST